MDWLPELVTLSDHGGNFAYYIDAVHRIFRRDFIASQPRFRYKLCYCDSQPEADGRERGFWHVVTSGAVESDRVPDLRRCERIGWPRAIIEAADTPAVRVWESIRRRPGKGQQTRVSLAPEDFSYLVVLQATKQAYVLITAYHLEHQHQREKKRREYEAYLKNS